MMRFWKSESAFVSFLATASSSSNHWRTSALFRRSCGGLGEAGGAAARSHQRSLVSFHGHVTQLSPRKQQPPSSSSSSSSSSREENNKNGAAPTRNTKYGVHRVIGNEPPPNPNQFLTPTEQEARVQELLEWYLDPDKRQILCLTGAGLSTESGIADYRGHQGSYYKGHVPMVHDHFMTSEYQRKRYWGRGLVGWQPFQAAQPNDGHYALATLEHYGKLGVSFSVDEDPNNLKHAPQIPNQSQEQPPQQQLEQQQQQQQQQQQRQRTLALITQNVDALHIRAGSRHVVELHGRSERIQCMNCGAVRDRADFHRQMEEMNVEWLAAARAATPSLHQALRPDGDAAVSDKQSYESVVVPSCSHCGVGFYKPDIVFFGDSVPLDRVAHCRAAVAACDGLLVVGSSLAVHSAFRHVRAACEVGISVAIVNVGETRAEVEGLPGLLKLAAPAGTTLRRLVEELQDRGHLLTTTTTTTPQTDWAPQEQP